MASAAAAMLYLEISRRPEILANPLNILAYSPDPETTWVGLALLVGLVIWRTSRRTKSSGGQGVEAVCTDGAAATTHGIEKSARTASDSFLAWLLSVVLFVLHVSMAWVVGCWFRGMPPAYHDEYSYLFQAKTFLAGRLYFPPHELPEFFNQMHVLNDNGVFASRYFPGVGLWLAPWVALGRPYWGQYLASGLIVVCIFWIGRELAIAVNRTGGAAMPSCSRGGLMIGFTGALVCAISPAMLIFSNLLLSHHPTMLGLAVFVLCYFRALRSESLGWPLVGGIALGFAMLCRPLTAFGFALPFGIHFAWLVWRGKLARCRPRMTAAIAPLAVGVGLLAGYNAALTGNPLESPYGLYTRTYTPNHCYGFHNVTRGQSQIGPKVLDNYNRWAEELTLTRACDLLMRRAGASSLWSIGRVTLAWALGILLVLLARLPAEWKLLAGAVLGVHAVYFPFGFEGIFELSYVFETVPLLCLLAGGVFVLLILYWRACGAWNRIGWVVVFVALGLYGPFLRLSIAIVEVQYARNYYSDFERKLSSAGVRPPALVLIDPKPTELHLDLVTNSPSLDDPILRARFGVGPGSDLLRLMKMSGRQVWLYDAKTGLLVTLRPE